MYLALTYDHRMLDGREAVIFLVKVSTPLSIVKDVLMLVWKGEGIYRGSKENAYWVRPYDGLSLIYTLVATLCRFACKVVFFEKLLRLPIQLLMIVPYSSQSFKNAAIEKEYLVLWVSLRRYVHRSNDKKLCVY